MSKWKWFALVPVLAGLLVFAPGLWGPRASTDRSEATDPVWPPDGGGELAASLPSLFQVGLALALVLGLALLGIFVLRRIQYGVVPADGREIQVKESRRLSPRRTLHLLRAGDRLLLLAESEQGVHLLSDLTPAEPEAAPTPLTDEPVIEEDGAVPRDLVIPRAPAAGRRPGSTFRELLNRLG